jgi:hypothetical protein
LLHLQLQKAVCLYGQLKFPVLYFLPWSVGLILFKFHNGVFVIAPSIFCHSHF